MIRSPATRRFSSRRLRAAVHSPRLRGLRDAMARRPVGSSWSMGRTELLDRAVDAHGGLRRWEEITRFRVAASITGTIWAMKGKPGLLDNVVFEGETRHQRLKIKFMKRILLMLIQYIGFGCNVFSRPGNILPMIFQTLKIKWRKSRLVIVLNYRIQWTKPYRLITIIRPDQEG